MEKETLYYKISEYLRGGLPVDEQLAFEREIAANAELALQVEIQRLEADSAEVLIEDELRQTMAAWDETEIKSPAALKTAGKRRGALFRIPVFYWAAAAGAALIIASVLFFRNNPEPNKAVADTPDPRDTQSVQKKPLEETPKEPVAEQQQSDGLPENRYRYLALAKSKMVTPNFGSVVRSSDAAVDPLADGTAAYKKGELGKAMQLWQTVPAQDENYGYALQFRAFTAFQLAVATQKTSEKQQYLGESAQLYREIIASESMELLHPEAEWNLLLVLLAKEGKSSPVFQQAREKIQTNQKHPYRQNAEDLQ